MSIHFSAEFLYYLTFNLDIRYLQKVKHTFMILPSDKIESYQYMREQVLCQCFQKQIFVSNPLRFRDNLHHQSLKTQALTKFIKSASPFFRESRQRNRTCLESAICCQRAKIVIDARNICAHPETIASLYLGVFSECNIRLDEKTI